MEHVDDLEAPRPVRWAAKSDHLEGVVKAAATGIEFGEVAAGNRRRPDRFLLQWRLTDPLVVIHDGVLPFFTDWDNTNTPHPTSSPPGCCELIGL